MSLCMARCFRVRVRMLIAAAIVLSPLSTERRYRPRRRGHCAVIPSGKPTSSEVSSPTAAAMGAASSDGPYARTAVSDGSLLRWR